MMQVLVSIILIGLCHAYTNKPVSEEYTDADVNSPLVLQNAQYVLTRSADQYWRRCTGAALVKVTKARHRVSYILFLPIFFFNKTT